MLYSSTYFLVTTFLQNLKKRIGYDNLLCLAHNVSGRWEEVLEDLSHEIQSVPEAELPNLSQRFPKGGIIGIMDEHQDSLPKSKENAHFFPKSQEVGFCITSLNENSSSFS